MIIKHKILLAFSLLMLALSSCADVKETDYLPLPDTIQLKAEPGMVRAVMEERGRITEYDFIEKENTLVLNPYIGTDGNTVYAYLGYSRDEVLQLIAMSEAEEEAYFETRPEDFSHEIEVYHNLEDAQPDQIISLKVPEDKEIKFHQMFFDSVNDVFMFKGVEKADEGWALYYYAFDINGGMIERMPLPDLDWNGNLSYNGSCLFTENSIYYLEQLPYDFKAQFDEFEFFRYDLLTDERTKLTDENVIGMFESDGVIYYFTQNYDEYGYSESMNLLYLDGEESVVVHKAFSPASRTLHDVKYDAVNQILYFTDGDAVYSYSFDDGITRQILMSGDKHLQISGITDDSIIILNGSYVTTAYERTAEKVSLTDNQVTLNLYRQMSADDTDRHQDIFRIMTVNGYSAKGETSVIEDAHEYQFAMAKKLLAGDTDFDIFYVSTEMADLMKGQYYEDLSQYPLLNGYYDRMVSGVKELCTIEGIPALIPVHLYTDSMRVNKSCVTGDATLARTLEDLLNIRKNIPLKSGSYLFSGTNLYILMRPWFEQLVSNYMADVISDKQAEKDLKLLFDLAEELKNDPQVYLNSGATTTPTLLRNLQNIGLDGSLSPDQTAAPMLKISEDYKHTWNGGFYAINPNSPNKEMAAVFLACLMERDRNLGFGNAQIYADAPEKNGSIRGNGSDVLYEVYLTQLADGVRGYEIPDFGDTLRDLFRKIENQEITASEAAKQLFRSIKMVKYE